MRSLLKVGADFALILLAVFKNKLVNLSLPRKQMKFKNHETNERGNQGFASFKSQYNGRDLTLVDFKKLNELPRR